MVKKFSNRLSVDGGGRQLATLSLVAANGEKCKLVRSFTIFMNVLIIVFIFSSLSRPPLLLQESCSGRRREWSVVGTGKPGDSQGMHEDQPLPIGC